MNATNDQSTHKPRRVAFSVSDALGMYQRLRLRGQNSVLARLSVEARCRELTSDQRSRLHQLLQQYEASVA